MLHNSLRASAALLFSLLTTGCESVLPSFYTVPMRQGNYIDQDTLAQLKPGMSKQQVQRLMGTPLVTDPFHQNRWDYYYQFGKGAQISEQRRVTLLFSGATLSTIEVVPEAVPN